MAFGGGLQAVRMDEEGHSNGHRVQDAQWPLQIQLAYQPLSSMKKPFHKWNYVIARPDQVASAVAKLKRSDRLDLKYRVVMQDVVSSGGREWVCAVAFR